MSTSMFRLSKQIDILVEQLVKTETQITKNEKYIKELKSKVLENVAPPCPICSNNIAVQVQEVSRPKSNVCNEIKAPDEWLVFMPLKYQNDPIYIAYYNFLNFNFYKLDPIIQDILENGLFKMQ